MITILQSIVCCLVFGFVVLWSLYKAPLDNILSYPVEIVQRVKSLPQYKDKFHLSAKKNKKAKILFVFGIAGIFALMSYCSGASTFVTAFVHTMILFMCMNLFDFFVMDLLIFRHCSFVRIPGTEDMIKAYHGIAHHAHGLLKGTAIAIFVSLISGAMVKITCIIK